MSSLVSVSTENGLAHLTLQNPSRRNAIDAPLADELVAACDAIDADESIGAVVVRGSGGYFCSGGDRDELAEVCKEPASNHSMGVISRIYAAFLRVGSLQPLTIAAVRGGALGAGLNLALATDLRVVSHDARIGSGFLGLGVHPGGGHFHLLRSLAGPEAAAALGLAGQAVDGQRAQQLGLAWASVPDHEVEPTAAELARTAAADPDLARRAKASFATSTAPATTWPAAVAIERTPQIWSFARKGAEAWDARERPLQV
ncbi:MAG: Enoyl-CoA hydratase/isomerase [Marmoricola sp.]|jgi:enoyl-CoA hydratase|nr:Enoyl-CoA hydratase/isomerase [Marmoricola sp.]